MSGPTIGASETGIHRWNARRTLALAIRAAVMFVPLGVSIAAVALLRGRLPAATGWSAVLTVFIPLVVTAVTTAIVAERLIRRLLPLASLMDLSLVFPDQVPSRFGLALRSGSTKKLARTVDDVTTNRFSPNNRRAALQVLDMIAALRRHEPRTHGHTERVRAYSEMIADELGLKSDDKERLAWAVLLHDVGKLTVPAELLNKDSEPTAGEWEIIKQHPTTGAAMVEPLRSWLGDYVDAAGQHHERFDGSGYPHGLAGKDISLAGRIVAVADAYDVITSTRSYKKAMSHDAARAELVRCAGTHFDPDVVKAMLRVSVGKITSLPARLSWLLDIPTLLRPIGAATAAATATVAAVAFAPPPVPQEVPAVEVAVLAPGPTATPLPKIIVTTKTPSEPPPAAQVPPTATPVSTRLDDPPEGIAMTDPTDGIALPTPPPVPTPRDGEGIPAPVAEPTVVPSPTPRPGTTPEPTRAPEATPTAEPTAAPEPTTTLEPAPAPEPTTTTEPAPTPEPTATPEPTPTPEPTATPEPTPTPEPTTTPSPCDIATSGENILAGLDLANCQLQGHDFNGVDLAGANLRGVDLSGGTIANFTLEGADLTGANLSGVRIQRGSMLGTKLDNANLTGIEMFEVDMAYASFAGADLSGSNIGNSSFGFANAPNMNLSNSNVGGVNFNDAILTGSNFSGSILSGGEFWRTIAPGINLDLAKIEGAVFGETVLTDATGIPLAPETATYISTVCPNGETSDTNCWE